MAVSKESRKAQLIDMYCSVMKKIGFEYEVDDEGNVDFKVKGVDLNFCAFIDADHELFIRVVCVAFYRISASDDLGKIYRACNDSNRKVKVSKVYVLGNEKSVFVGFEAFAQELNEVSLERYINSAVNVNGVAIKHFIQALSEEG